MPTLPSLDGSAIVLAHPRTGSSLLMQTLRLLGMPVVGVAKRPDLPATANPRGYYEHGEILAQGLLSPETTRDPLMLRGRAVKLAVTAMIRRTEQGTSGEWELMRRANAVILIPIRHPAESLLSREIFELDEAVRRKATMRIFADIRRMLCDYAYLCTWICGQASSRPAPHCIDYGMAQSNPVGYVTRIASLARLEPSEASLQAAIGNIQSTLHRYRLENLPAELQDWIKTSRLDRIYHLLRENPADVWSRVLREIPAWAHR